MYEKLLKAWHIWMIKKRMALAARELEYGKRLAEYAEIQGHSARRDLMAIETPATVYDCRLRRVS